MAIGGDFIVDLIWLKNSGRLNDCRSVIELGAQQLAESFFLIPEELEELYALIGGKNPFADTKAPDTHIVHGNLRHLSPEAPAARIFWESMGFEYAALDILGDDSVINMDLNFDSVPCESKNRYDFVTNFGTSEHVCNQFNVFRIMHDLTKPGGYMYHVLPCAGLPNHGLFNYNPKFFWALIRSNGYEVVFFDVSPTGTPYKMPKDVIHQLKSYARDLSWKDRFTTEDVAIKVMVKKVHDMDFVAPIDVEDKNFRNCEFIRGKYGAILEKAPPNKLLSFAADAYVKLKKGLHALFVQRLRRLMRLFSHEHLNSSKQETGKNLASRENHRDAPQSETADLKKMVSEIAEENRRLKERILRRLPGRQVIFFHIPKTAGASVTNYLTEAFDGFPHMIGPVNRLDDEAEDFLVAQNMVSAHFGYNHLARCSADSFVFTFVRDPVDQFLSHYYSLREWTGEVTDYSRKVWKAANEFDLADFLDVDDHDVTKFTVNPVSYALHSDWRTPRSLPEDDVVEVAVRHLSEFDVVCLYERFADSLMLLQYRMNWPFTPDIGRANVTQERPARSVVSPELISRIRQLNSADVRVYEAAKQRFERDWVVFDPLIKARQAHRAYQGKVKE